MAVPAEILNEDVKELKAEIREIRDDIGVIKGDLHTLALSLAKLSAEFGVFRWTVGLTLALGLTGIAGAIWWGATLTNEVKHQGVLMGKIEARFDRVDARFDRLEAANARVTPSNPRPEVKP